MSVTRPLVGVVADDITGAGDIAGLFAGHGYAARVFTHDASLETVKARIQSARTDVAVVDTDSRLLEPVEAAERVRRATRALLEAGCTLFWKKTCSVFRGNVGQEFDAMLEVLRERFGVAVAAFPKNGRTTVNGVHRVRGVPLAESEFAHDPVHPRTTSNLVESLGAQTKRHVVSIGLEHVRVDLDATLDAAEHAGAGYALLDAETQDDLARIARAVATERVILGSSALAEELPRVWEQPAPFDALEGVHLNSRAGVFGIAAGVFGIAASVMPQTRAQLEAFTRAGGTVLVMDSRAALESPDETVQDLVTASSAILERGGDVVVRSENTADGVAAARAYGAGLGLDAVAVSTRVSSLLAEVAKRAALETGVGRLVALGGDTSAALCRALEVAELLTLFELAPGLPMSLVVGAEPRLLVLKSGSFGAADFLLEAVRRLRATGGA
jgi:uncharacterized protein YgbK (DUF1537 family)